VSSVPTTTTAAARDVGTLARVELEHLELAPNKRRDIDPESIRTLAAMLGRTGQLVPCIGYRPDPDDPKVVLCAGQRRLLAARASHTLTGTPGFDGLAPIHSLVVLPLDHAPGEHEVRRVQAQENAREPLSLRDQQEQFRDCWQARAGLPETDRMAVVCADVGISAGKGHSLRRQLALPDAIRERVAERPAGAQLSVRMAHRLADIHDVAPELAQAVAARVTSRDRGRAGRDARSHAARCRRRSSSGKPRVAWHAAGRRPERRHATKGAWLDPELRTSAWPARSAATSSPSRSAIAVQHVWRSTCGVRRVGGRSAWAAGDDLANRLMGGRWSTPTCCRPCRTVRGRWLGTRPVPHAIGTRQHV